MNPFEFLLFQVLYATPLFAFPIHGAVFVAELLYLYYFGLMDHSGVRMQSWLPWQPSTMFHDDHHKLVVAIQLVSRIAQCPESPDSV